MPLVALIVTTLYVKRILRKEQDVLGEEQELFRKELRQVRLGRLQLRKIVFHLTNRSDILSERFVFALKICYIFKRFAFEAVRP